MLIIKYIQFIRFYIIDTPWGTDKCTTPIKEFEMKKLTIAFFTLLLAWMPAQADNNLTKDEALTLVQPFYNLLSNKESVENASKAFHKDWKSYYSNEGYKTLDQTMGFLTGPLVKMVPDINWEIKSISVTSDNQIIVRGEGSGTPAGEKFFGQPVSGKSFRMMSIDIHEVTDGKIIRSYHIEDWAGALRQLAAGS